MKRQMRPMCAALAAVAGLICNSSSLSAQQSFFDFSLTQGTVHISFPTNASQYFVLQDSLDLKTFTADIIAFGTNAVSYQTPATKPAQFFLAESISIYSPQQTLHDGIDDVFKLNEGLNPLDTSLASSNSGFVDVDGRPLTWLQYYNQTFARNIATNDIICREFSVFNFGRPAARLEAFSQEVSLYNGQSASLVAIPQEIYGREVSVFNAGSFVGTEAMSREVSLYNGESAPLVASPQEVYSHEASVFNAGTAPASEANSREVSVFNPGGNASIAVSREVSVFNNALN